MKTVQSFKKRGLLLLPLLLLFFCLSQQLCAQVFEKNYGTLLDNSFTKVIEDGADYYVLGTDEATPGTLARATVTRITANGNWAWTLSLDIPSVWHDAVLTPSGDLMLVGSTLPFDANNESLLARVSPQNNGSFSFLQRFNVEGRESFYRIVFNLLPDDPAYPYYILGGQYQVGGIAFVDDVVLLNLDEDCNFNWKKSISTSNDDEWLRDLEVLANGDLLMCGNDEASGKIFRTDNAGVVINGFQIGSQVFRSISKNAAGGFLAAANAFTANQAFIYKLDQDLIHQWNAQIPALNSVSQIWEAAPGIIYVVGNGFFNGSNREVIIKIDDTDPLLGPGILWVKYFSAGSNFSGGSAWFLPPGELAYTDTRIIPGGFGGTCAFMSVSDLELNTCLVSTVTAQLTLLDPLPEGPPFPPTLTLAPPMGLALVGAHLMYEEDVVCGDTCEVNIVVTAINPCGLVQICASATGPSPYDYQWCDGQNTACFTTQLSWGEHDFCVSITCSDGTLASSVLTYSFSETVPPVLSNCPPSQSVIGTYNADGACEAQVVVVSPTATDNCDPSVTPINNYNNSGNASGIYSQGNTTVTWTATDDCGNSANCTFTVEVNCDTCSCLGFDSLVFYYGTPPTNGWSIPVSCEADSTTMLPWVPSDGLYNLQGYLQCSDSCNTSVDYAVIAEDGSSVSSGTATLGPVGGGQTYFNVITGFHPAPGNYQFVLTGHCGSDTCVCSIDFSVPDCDTCGCGTYTDLFYRPVQGAPNQSISCGETLFAQCDGPIDWTLGGNYLCSGPNCPSVTSMSWMLMGPSGNSSGNMSANAGFNLLIPATEFNVTGLHQLTLKALCGQDTCYCDFLVEVTCDTCQCGTFSDMFIRGPQGAMSQPVACGDPPINIGCPAPGIGYTLTGNFQCDGAGCPPEADLDWTLTGPDGSSVASGATQGPWFALNLASVYFAQPGVYTLTLSGYCGGQLCTCIIQFIVEEGCMDTCPCDIDDLLSDVNHGFAVSLAGNSCQACFTPLSLSDCDEVDWLVDDPLGTPVGTSTYNQTFCYSFPVAGTYTVYMVVTRKRADGTLCESFTKAQTVTVTCINRADCNESVLINPSFSEGAVAGGLSSGGISLGWQAALGEPIVISGSADSHDDWTIELTGSLDDVNMLSSAEPVCLMKDTGTISIRHKIEHWGDPHENLNGKHIKDWKGKVIMYQGAPPGPGACNGQACFEVASFELTSPDTGWVDVLIPYDLREWMSLESCTDSQTVFVHLAFYVTSVYSDLQGGGLTRARVEVDNICLGDQVVAVRSHRTTRSISLFPNPTTGDLKFKFDGLSLNWTQLEILDIRGRVVQQQRLERGIEELTLNLAALPSGIYFVKIREAGVAVWVEKVVKL